MNRIAGFWLTVTMLSGLLLVFVGERLISPEPAHLAVSGLGGGLVALSLVARLVRFAGSRDDRRGIEGAFAAVSALGVLVVALALFFGAEPREADFPRLLGVMRALLPVLVACTVLPLIFGELAYASMAHADRVEGPRVHSGIRAGFGLAFVLVFAFAAYYVAAERDAKVDLSYSRVAKPGEGTRNIVRALDEPVTVMSFYPPANDVGVSVQEYLSALAGESPQFKLERYDVAVDPEKAKALGVSSNGAVLITRGGRKETMLVGLEIDRARGELRSFDGDFQKKLLAVTRTRKTVYLVAGHGERAQEGGAQVDKKSLIRMFVREVEGMNHTVKSLGAADGLGSEIPSDAAAVMVIGPTEALDPAEVATLHRYFDGGGRLFIALDPAEKADHAALLTPLGLRHQPALLANDRAYYSLTKQPSDRTTIATISFSSHPSVTSLGQLGRKAPMVLKNAGALEVLEDKPKDVLVEFSVHADSATWNDVNGNFLFDSGPEVRKSYELAAAVRKGAGPTEARAVVVSDSDLLTDGLFEFDGNYYFAREGMTWALGEESVTGEVSREQDVPIQHTRKQDVLWFYSSVFVMPALVLLVGWFASRKRRRSGGVRSTARKAGAA